MVKKVNAIQTTDTSNLVKKADYDTKIDEIEKKIDNNIIKLVAENFTARLKQAKLATKDDISDFVKKTYFDEKLRNINKKVTSNTTKHLKTEKKQKNLSEKGKLILEKRLTKDWIKGYSILNSAKYFLEKRDHKII